MKRSIHKAAARLTKGEAPLGLRQGTITAVDLATQSLTVTIGGGTAAVSGIRYIDSMYPVVGSAVWLIRNRRDWIAIATIGQPRLIPTRRYRTSNANITAGAAFQISTATVYGTGSDFDVPWTTGGSSGDQGWDLSNPGWYMLRVSVPWALAGHAGTGRVFAGWKNDAGSMRVQGNQDAGSTTGWKQDVMRFWRTDMDGDLASLYVFQNQGSTLTMPGGTGVNEDTIINECTYLGPIG